MSLPLARIHSTNHHAIHTLIPNKCYSMLEQRTTLLLCLYLGHVPIHGGVAQNDVRPFECPSTQSTRQPWDRRACFWGWLCVRFWWNKWGADERSIRSVDDLTDSTRAVDRSIASVTHVRVDRNRYTVQLHTYIPTHTWTNTDLHHRPQVRHLRIVARVAKLAPLPPLPAKSNLRHVYGYAWISARV